MTTNKHRQQLRQQVRTLRNGLTEHFQRQAALDLVGQIADTRIVNANNAVAIYLANDGELDTLPFIHWCWQNSINTYLPVLHPFNPGHLIFMHYHADTVMVANKYGIAEPKTNVLDICPASQLDIIFTPLVAFDDTGARLGMGGGYYDRTLSTLPAHQPLVVGLAHDCQQVSSIPVEAWDMPLSHIITPSQHHDFKR